MTFKTTQLRDAITFALAVGATALVGTGTAFAQEATTENQQATTLDRIEVTGSRIKRADVETASPVVVLDRQAIEATGLQTVGDVIKNLSQADSQGLTNLTSDTNANDGTQTVSLRGLGSARTLVLVNGRRWVALGGGAVDVTTIPTAIIERVEVLTDGASAIYGSDAIGGVINLILRNNFEGAEASLYYGQNSYGDGGLTRANVTYGATSDRGAVLLNIDKSKQDPIFAGDRELSKFPVAFVPQAFGSAFNEFGIFIVPGRGVLALNPTREGPGMRTAADFEPFGNKHRYNFAPTNYLLTPSDRLSAYAQGHYDLTDNLRFFSQMNFNQRKSVTQIAEVPLTMGFSGPQWVIPIAANNVYNPFGVQINQSGMRMSALGPRTNVQDYDTYMFTGGLEGNFDFADRTFDWDAYYSRGESTRSSTGENYVNLFNLRTALGPSFFDGAGVARCGAPGNVITGCVPLNLFNGQTGMTPDMMNYVGYTITQQIVLGMTNWGVNFTGDLFDLPGGPAAFATGYEYRRNSIVDIPDALVAGGGSSNNFREPTSGETVAKEYYLELSLPLLADVPFAKRLELTLAGRKSDYDNSGLIGSTPTTRSFASDSYKYGFAWKPFDDLMVRGNYADTFRAPAVNNLFGGGGEGFPSAIDPCTNAAFAGNPYAGLTAEQRARCTAQGVPPGGSLQPTSQLRGLFGGNPLLNPESGRTKTLGLVYSPGWVEGLDLTLDWYEISLKDGLASRSAQAILNGCIRTGDPTDCSFISRDGSGAIDTIRVGQFNLANVLVEGYDFSARYRWDTPYGDFRFRWENSYTSKGLVTTGNLSQAQNVVGRASGVFGGPTWRLRSNFNVDWTRGDWGLNWGVRYLSKLAEDCSGYQTLFDRGLATQQLCSDPTRIVNSPTTGRPIAAPRNNVPRTFYHDVQARLNTPWNAEVRLGVRNVLDKDPPRMVSPFANSFDDAYDIPGRFIYMQYKQQF